MNKRGKKEHSHGSDLPSPNSTSVPTLCLRIGSFGKTTAPVPTAKHVIVWHMAFAFVQMGSTVLAASPPRLLLTPGLLAAGTERAWTVQA